MSLKTKLTSLITTFVLLCSLLTVGVFAVKNTTFNVGGSIEFNVKGIEASIKMISNSGFKTTNGKAIGTDVLTDITLNNDMSAQAVADAFAPWSGLELEFVEGATTATIVLEIENTVQSEEEGVVPDNYLDISAMASVTTTNNARIKVENNAGGVTALLQQGDKATYTITFEIVDDGYSASLEGFSVNFDLQKKVSTDFDVLSADMTYQTLKFRTIDGEDGLSVEDIGAEQTMEDDEWGNYYQSTGNLVIPAYVNNGGTIYPVRTIANNAFGYDMSYAGSSIENISIPKTITSIGDSAFFACESLSSITMPYSVEAIGDWVFFGCIDLTNLTISASVISIGEDVFSACTSLESIVIENANSIYDSRNNCNAIIETATNTLITGCKNTVIPNTVTSIGYSAFYECAGLTSITIPDSVEAIGDYAFSGCIDLTSIIIRAGVTSIGETAFQGCSGLTSITIPDSVTRIGLGAFDRCSSLTSITIPDSVTTIEGAAFCGCSSLTSITIPDSVTSIEFNTFNGCSSLTSIALPDSVEVIGEYAFYGCSSLTSITIPDSVTTIEGAAFSDCSGLTSITIPDSVTRIGKSAFYINSLTSIVVDSGNSVYDSRSNCNAIIETATNTLLYGCQNTIIPNSVKRIGGSAFSGCKSLTSITIPDSIEAIEDGAFFYCKSLTSITIPDSVTSIGKSAFSSCESLTSITIPDSVEAIGDSVFASCKGLTSITLSNSITSIGKEAFDSCSSLTSLTIPDGVTSIGKSAFDGCSSLTSITIPASVTSIGDWVFYNTTKLKTINYRGTEEQWDELLKNDGYGNNYLNVAKKVYNYTGA